MNETLRRFAPQKVRRVLVALYFLLFLNGLAILFFGAGGTSKQAEMFGLFSVIAAAMLGGLFYYVSSPADFRPANQLDERQQSIRLKAMADSYRIVCFLLIAAHLVYGLQAIYGYSLGPRTAFSGNSPFIFFPFILLLPSLPQALVAWRDPDLFESPDRVSLP
jgi:hypothetical protein